MKLQSDHPEVEDGHPTPSELQLQETMGKVFRIPLLQEKILEHVIYSFDKRVNYANLSNVRLVQKSWLISTTQMLRRNHDHLYYVSTSPINSRDEVIDLEDYEILNSFVLTITQPERIEIFIPPISLDLVCSFFVPRNREALSEFLVTCGPGVTSLNMAIPKRCTLPFLFPRFSLPNLHQLKIKFVSHSHSDDDNAFGDGFIRENTAVTYFIQQILNSTRQLEKLEFSAGVLAESDLIPACFDLLCVPKSVTTLLIKCPVLDKHLKMVVPSNSKAMHACLTKLEIMASEMPFPEGIINRILAKHCESLKEIKLSGKEFQWVNVSRPSLFKIPPTMKSLEKITLASPSWICDGSFCTKFTSTYTNLTTFQMKRITLDLFNQITERYQSNLRAVKRLKVWLVKERDIVNHFETTITLNSIRMQRAHLTFSCVVNLDITICGKTTSGLKYIFSEMGQLTSLVINVENLKAKNMTCEEWDGLLIGAPTGIARGLRQNMDFWDHFKLKVDKNFPSIQKLTALSKLTLATSNFPIHYGSVSGMRGRMISEVSFHYAFLKMPALKDLSLFGRFAPNEVMISLWNKGKEPDCSLIHDII